MMSVKGSSEEERKMFTTSLLQDDLNDGKVRKKKFKTRDALTSAHTIYKREEKESNDPIYLNLHPHFAKAALNRALDTKKAGGKYVLPHKFTFTTL